MGREKEKERKSERERDRELKREEDPLPAGASLIVVGFKRGENCVCCCLATLKQT